MARVAGREPGAQADEETLRVLSIQSHVVHGYVGNKSAVFPLQLLGIEVDQVNTVHFSNHTGYPTVKGTVMDGEQLLEIIRGLEANDLIAYSHLLTGYIGSATVLQVIVDLLSVLKKKFAGLTYVCDPVLGDMGHLYVKPELVGIFIDRVIPLADIVTPNHYELEVLTGMQVGSDADLFRAVDMLHAKGPKTVVVTSIEGRGGTREAAGEEASTSTIEVVVDTLLPQDEGYLSRFTIGIQRLDYNFTGSGDLTSALLLAWCSRHPTRVQHAVEMCMSTVYKILRSTAEHGKRPGYVGRAGMPELRLIQNQHEIVSPEQIFFAKSLEGQGEDKWAVPHHKE